MKRQFCASRAASFVYVIMPILITLFLWCAMMVSVPVWGEAQGLDSPLAVSIQMTKPSYALEEEIDGVVVIINASAISFPAIFDIQLFYKDALVESVSVAIKSFLPGANKYNFKELGIPQNHFRKEGQWRITIRQKDVDDSYAAEAEFVVQP